MRATQLKTRNLILVALVVMALGATLLAVHDIFIFELEGDATDDGLIVGEDWDRVLGFGSFTDPSGSDDAHAFVNDGAGTTIYTTGGSKDDLNVSSWRYTDGMVPDKDEILNAYSAAYVNPSTVGDNLAGDLILYFGADRFANNGDSQIGFWFFKKPVNLGPNGTFVDGDGNPAVHTVGDILILSDFTNGGRISTIKVYEWVGSGGDTNGTLNLLFTGQDCHDTGLANDAACATVNDIAKSAPWPYTPKFGSSGTFPAGSFFEGGINISRLDRENNRPSPGCFTSFIGETRSSQQPDATLKDFALGAFDLCAARISIEQDATNEVGDDHTFTITVEKKGPPNYTFAPASGIEVTASLESGSVGSFVGSNVCTTDTNGECTVTISSSVAGTSTVSASASVTLEGITFNLETDGEDGNSDAAVKTWVDAKISIGDPGPNEVGDPHTFTVTLQKNPGSGFVAASGEHVSFTLTDAFGANCQVDADESTCDNAGANTDSNGQCTIVFSSDSVGQCVGHASATLSVGGVSLTRETDGTGGNSGDATKTYVDARISVTPLTATNPLNEAHTITATVEINAGGGAGWVAAPNGTSVTFSLLNNTAGAVFVDSVSTCATAGGNGQCSVQINSSSGGGVDIHASTTLSVGGVSLTRTTGSTGNGADAHKTYVEKGRIKIKKETDPDGSTQSFSFTAGYDSDGFSLKDGEENDSGSLDPGSYTVAESVPSGWDLTSIQCSGETDSVITPGDGGFFPEHSVNIQLVAGETITCTFNNQADANIIVKKETEPDGDTTLFHFNAGYDSDGFNLADGQQNDSGDLDPGSYSVSEVGQTGWDLTSSTCVSSKGDTETPASISLQAGETVTCTFNNRKRGTIIVEKQTDPDGASGSFTFTGDAAGSIGDGQQITVSNIVAGTYTSTEADPTPNFDLTSIACNDGASANASSGNVETRTATFKLDPGETVKCTFTNTQRGMAKVIKSFLGQPLGGTLSFSFDLRVDASLTSLGTVLESGTANAGNSGVINFSTKLVAGDTYQLCETGILPGWDTSLAHTTGVFVPGGSLPDPDNSTLCINFTVDPGQTREFRINNTPPPNGLAHTIGFWKNWTSCDGHGNQAPILDQTLGSVGGILIGDLPVDTCPEAVSILDKSDINSGRKMASDPAYGLAAQLLAAELNFIAGANTCAAATDAAAQAQALLDSIDFIGTGSYANKGKNKLAWQADATTLAGILDAYNNNLLCFEF